MIDLFAGVGGIRLGFEQAFHDMAETIFASEWDPYAVETYRANFKDKFPVAGDITKINETDIPDFDVCLAGFPCQAFSIAGNREGFADDYKGMCRGTLFLDVVRICAGKKPEVILCENVKGLIGHDGGRTFDVIKSSFESIGYTVLWKVLNSRDYGVPQNRERVYLVCFRDKKTAERFQWPLKSFYCPGIRTVIDFTNPVDEKYYYEPGKFSGDIYEKLAEAMKDDDPNDPAVYQWRRHYVRKNKSGVIPTLTANQGEGGHNVCLIKTDDGRIRKMTPRECFNAQGFPKDFVLPETLSDSRLYKQAGNSVSVPVIKAIAKEVRRALE